MSKTQRIPLYGSFVGRNTNPASFTGGAQIFVNCFPAVEKNELTREAKVYLNKRPGGSTGATLASSGFGFQLPALIWTGATSASQQLLLTLSKSGTGAEVWNSANTQIGTTISTAGASKVTSLTETLISSTSNLVLLHLDGTTQEMWFFPEGGAWTEITDGDRPVGAGFVIVGEPAHMDGYMFIMDTLGGISNSDLNSLSAWTAGNRIVAGSMPDGGVGVARLKNLIVAFGTSSIEFFQNAGNASGSPLSPIGNAVRRVGAEYNRDATSPNRPIFTLGDAIYFVGRDSETGLRGLYRLQDFTPQKISTDSVDALLNSLSAPPSIVGAIKLGGQEHLVTDVAFGTDKQLCISIGNGFPWFFSFQDSTTAIKSCVYSIWTTATSRVVSAHDPTSPVYQDNAVAYTATVQFGPLDMGTNNRKAWLLFDLIGDKQTTSGNTAISYSDDSGANYSTPVNVDMSAPPCRVRRLGMSRRRLWKVADAVNRPWRVEFADIEADIASA